MIMIMPTTVTSVFMTTTGIIIAFTVCIFINSIYLIYLQIRERFKRRIRLIFPAAGNGASNIKRSSEMNESSGIVSLRKIEVIPGSMYSQSNETLVQVSL